MSVGFSGLRALCSSSITSNLSVGLIGDYHSGRWTQFAGSVGLSFISGAAAATAATVALESQQANAFGFNQPEQSTQNAILNGLARATLDQGKRMGDTKWLILPVSSTSFLKV